jgi:hypothetical protein
VEVALDDQVYQIQDRHAGPIVCQLKPGHHRLEMSRAGQVLYHEDFIVMRGQDRILSAWRQPDTPTPPIWTGADPSQIANRTAFRPNHSRMMTPGQL